jgi:hypothetical protein
VFREMPLNLRQQREEMRALLESQRSAAGAADQDPARGTPTRAHEG